MALKYHLVRRPDLRKNVPEGSTLFFPQVRSTNRIRFKELCEELTHLSSASPGDVAGVLRGLTYIIRKNLLQGNSVQLGDFGSFRISAGSKGAKTEKEFHTSLFKRPRIIYTPGAPIKETTLRVKYTQLEVKEYDNTSCDRNHAV